MARKSKKHFKGLGFIRDHHFLRNITIIFAAIFIWRGTWNILDNHFMVGAPLASNVTTILIGFMLLFIFDKEVEADK
jgi:hypothetical protein